MFRLRGKDATIVTDPFDRGLGLEVPRPKADIVTISQDHPHHNAMRPRSRASRGCCGPGRVRGQGRLHHRRRHLRRQQEGRAARQEHGLCLRAGRPDHLPPGQPGPCADRQAGRGVERCACAAGAGGRPDALDAARAAEVIAQIEPRIVMPMHVSHRTRNRSSVETLERFAREMGLKEWNAQDKLVLEKHPICRRRPGRECCEVKQLAGQGPGVHQPLLAPSLLWYH